MFFFDVNDVPMQTSNTTEITTNRYEK